MTYAVFTAKHHDGYILFDSATTDFGIMHSRARRDLFREFAAAMRDAGIRVGVYFSLSDWSHRDYPAVGDADVPYSFHRFAKVRVAVDRCALS
jgi:alpha-L-fucosidase